MTHFLQMWHIGCAPPFQGGQAGSSPAICSKFISPRSSVGRAFFTEYCSFSAILIIMENEQLCMHCGQSGWASLRGMRYHQRFCEKNPDRQKPSPKTDAFYEAMRERRGRATNQWTNFDWETVSFDDLSFRRKRRLLFEKSNFACSLCGFNKVRDCGGIILEIDHIDGDHTNNTLDNLRVLCPNCHALTHNFRNWGRTSKEKTSGRIRKGNKCRSSD